VNLFFGAPFLFTIILVIFAFALLFTLRLNSKGSFLAARLHFTASSYFFLIFQSLATGKSANFHFFLLAEVLALFFIFPPSQKAWKLGLAFFVLFSFAALQLPRHFMSPFANLQIPVANQILTEVSLGVLIFCFAFYINSIFLNAEKYLEFEQQKSEQLLLNILPPSIALELKASGSTKPVHFESASILFTDFKGFTTIAETLSPQDLVAELDRCFSYFDSLMDRYNLEKLKTIGDSFMCAGGIPVTNKTHAIDCILAAMEIQAFMNQMKELKAMQGLPYWELRLGINSLPLVAVVIGAKKFAYDVWSDTVNTASSCESSGVPGRINISGTTYASVKDFFECEFRGHIAAKHKGEIEMYFVTGLRPELSRNGDGRVPNDRFKELYQSVANS